MYFGNADLLYEFLQDQKKQFGLKGAVQKMREHIHLLENKCMQCFEKKVKRLVDFFCFIIMTSSQQSRQLYKSIKHLNPDIDLKFISVKKAVDSRFILDINKQVIDKINNYLRNQDPNNNDDFVILRRDEKQKQDNKPPAGLLTELS